MKDKTFYDIHMHAYNLSHPYLRAFIMRFNFGLFLAFTPFVAPLLPFLGKIFKKKIGCLMNLLAVMEDDIDSIFLLLENCLRENKMLDNDGLHIGGNTYEKIILTPLMMDFGYKRMKKDKDIHYNQPCRKPIRRQVIDVFNALTYYYDFVYTERYAKGFPHLKPDAQGRPTRRVFEIYPFIGINTLNYEYEELVELMKKYFGDYKGDRDALIQTRGKFDGNIEHLSSNFAGGIKLYPPLDFDPWPQGNEIEMKKVRYIYSYCQGKGIPITVHGSESGFVVVSKRRLKNLTSISKWEAVFSEYPRLKLNLAHFPVNEKYLWIFPKTTRLKQVLRLLSNPKYENFYVDFSCRALNHGYYKVLKKLVSDASPEIKDILSKRIMFGTDFSINLASIDSYNAYYDLFSKDKSFESMEKDRFCSANPESFLFAKSSGK